MILHTVQVFPAQTGDSFVWPLFYAIYFQQLSFVKDNFFVESSPQQFATISWKMNGLL